jgi:hypothetical protein
MLLYVNGDSHAAAAEAVNVHAFAEDDSEFFYLGRAPHPANLAVSWSMLLSLAVKATLINAAESASSNARILRTTRQWLADNPRGERLVVIQWSTWEREEWLIDDQYYQINASGIDSVPDAYQQRYKQFVASVDWQAKTQQAHDAIWAFHCELLDQNVNHIFFNGNNHFGDIEDRKDWGTSYMDPYDANGTYESVLKNNGYQTVSPVSWHFGQDGHAFWNRYMLKYIVRNKIL